MLDPLVRWMKRTVSDARLLPVGRRRWRLAHLGVECLEPRDLPSMAVPFPAAFSPVQINATASTVGNPAVAMAGNGDFVTATANSTNQDIEYNFFNSQLVQSGPVQANGSVGSSLDNPSVAIDAAGDRFVVAWDNNTSGTNTVRFQLFQRVAAGAAVGTITPLGEVYVDTTNFVPGFPRVAMDAAGNFVIAYQTQLGPNVAILAERFDSDGNSLDDPVTVATGLPAGSLKAFALDMNVADAFAVDWVDQATSGVTNLHYEVFDSSDNVLQGPGVVALANNTHVATVAVGLDNAGNLQLVYENDPTAAANGLFVQRIDSTGTVKPAVPLFVNNPQPTNGFAVAVDHTPVSLGSFVVAYDQPLSNANQIKAAAFTATDGILQGPVNVNDPNNQDGGFVSLGLRDPQNFVVAWNQSTGTQADWVQPFVPDTTTVKSIATVGPTSTSAATVSWTVTFANAVSNVTATNFQLVPGNGLGGSPTIQSVTPAGGSSSSPQWTVTASTGSGSGTLGLNFVGNGNITPPTQVTNTLTGPTFNLIQLAISPPSLPAAFLGNAYSQALSASGGTGPYQFAVMNGTALPPGLTLSTGGTLSGTPTSAGVFTFTVIATDSSTGPGAPFTGSQTYTVTVNTVTATQFVIDAPGAATAGFPFNFTVIAEDAAQHIDTGYTGTITLSTSDVQGTLSTLTYTFALADAGQQTFSATLGTAGNQTITAADESLQLIQFGGTVTGGTFRLGFAGRVTNPIPFGATPAAVQTELETLPGLGPGNVTVTGSSGNYQVQLPPGTVQLLSATSALIGTAPTIAVTTPFAGTSNAIAITAAAITHFTVTAPPTATVGAPFQFTVTPQDQFNNTAPTYGGTVHFTSSDGIPLLPGDSTLSNGVGTFTAILQTFGNQTITATDTIDSDLTGPSAAIAVSAVISLTAPPLQDAQVGADYLQTLAAGGGTFPYTFTVTSGNLPGGLTLSLSGVLSGQPTASGTFSFTVTAKDSSPSPGPFSGSQTYSLTVNQAPTITTAAGTTFTVGSAGSFPVLATGFPGPIVTETGPLPGGVTFNAAGVLTGTPKPGTGGSYSLTFTASNGIMPDDVQPFTLTVNETPQITSANHATFTAGTDGSFQVTTLGFPLPALSQSIVLPGGVTFTDNGDGTATLGGDPDPGTGGTYVFTVTASNGVLPDATQTFTLTINEAPAITSVPGTTFIVDSAGTFPVTTTGFPNPHLSMSGKLPNGISLNSAGVLSGTPKPGSGGLYSLTFTAANGISPDAVQPFTLDVLEAPAITSTDHTTFTVGSGSSFTVTTVGFPIAFLSESGLLPSGVGFTDNGDGTATLSGTPDPGTGGTYVFTITAESDLPPPGSQTFTLTINEAPVITSPDNTTFTVGQGAFFQVSTGPGFPTPVISESGGLPAGITFTDKGDGTATLGGFPKAGSGGVYSLKFGAANGVLPNASQAFTLTVNEPPAITSGNTTTFSEGNTGFFQVTATGFPAPSLSETTGNLPSGVSFDPQTGLLFGTPAPGTAGTYNLIFVASNGVSSDDLVINATQTFTLIVVAAPLPPADPTPDPVPTPAPSDPPPAPSDPVPIAPPVVPIIMAPTPATDAGAMARATGSIVQGLLIGDGSVTVVVDLESSSRRRRNDIYLLTDDSTKIHALSSTAPVIFDRIVGGDFFMLDPKDPKAGLISGVIFEDYDGTGVRDRNKPPQAGVVVYVDLNNNGYLDDGEPRAITNQKGEYRFLGLKAGTYTIRQQLLPQYVQTFPSRGGQQVKLLEHQVISEVNFGSAKVRGRRRPTSPTAVPSEPRPTGRRASEANPVVQAGDVAPAVNSTSETREEEGTVGPVSSNSPRGRSWTDWLWLGAVWIAGLCMVQPRCALPRNDERRPRT